MPTAAIEIAWKADDATLFTVPEAGYHVAPDAFADLHVTWPDHELTLSAPGTAAAAGLWIPDLRGATVTGELAVSICDDSGTVCKRETLGFFGAVPNEKKGRVTLMPRSVPEPVGAPETGATRFEFTRTPRPSEQADAAFAAATADGTLVLLDFGAVWCPPCNQLSAEVLDAPGADEALSGYHLVKVDVDDAGSWALKDEYAVTGYPTVIAAKADRAEVGRALGYEGRDAFLAWLQSNREGGLLARAARDPATVDPHEAAGIALELVRVDRDASAWLARAATDDPAFRRARLASNGDVEGPADPRAVAVIEDVDWLVAHDVPASLWAHDAAGLARIDDALRTKLRDALGRDTSGDALAAADRLELLGDLADDEAEARASFAAAAVVLRAWFTGDAARDRSQYTWYADLLENAGQIDEAVAFLDDAARTFPDEMTFSHAAGKMLHRAGRDAEALVRLDAAWKAAWGDNKLRVAIARTDVLVALGRVSEAKTFADAVLAEFPEPPEGVDVRTTRYRAQLARAVPTAVPGPVADPGRAANAAP